MANPHPAEGNRFKKGDDRCYRNGRRPGIAVLWERDAAKDLPAIVAQTNLADAIVEELGGYDSVSAVKMVLIERFAFLAVYSRQLEERIALGMSQEKEEKTAGRLVALVNCLKATGNSVGLDKVDELESLYPKVAG